MPRAWHCAPPPINCAPAHARAPPRALRLPRPPPAPPAHAARVGGASAAPRAPKILPASAWAGSDSSTLDSTVRAAGATTAGSSLRRWRGWRGEGDAGRPLGACGSASPYPNLAAAAPSPDPPPPPSPSHLRSAGLCCARTTRRGAAPHAAPRAWKGVARTARACCIVTAALTGGGGGGGGLRGGAWAGALLLGVWRCPGQRPLPPENLASRPGWPADAPHWHAGALKSGGLWCKRVGGGGSSWRAAAAAANAGERSRPAAPLGSRERVRHQCHRQQQQ